MHRLPASPLSRHCGIRLHILGILSLSMTGCPIFASFVNPEFHDLAATYSDLAPRQTSRPVIVSCRFEVNGMHVAFLDHTIQRRAERVLEKSGLFTVIEEASSQDVDRLDITVNNVGNFGGAAVKGIMTAGTLGLFGTEVTDGYIMTAIYTHANCPPTTVRFRHAINSTVGATTLVKEGKPKWIMRAFDQVMEDLVLNALREFQHQGLL